MNDYAFLQTTKTESFQPQGSGSPFKTDYEMTQMDSKEADNAFKFCKKTILDTYMKSRGFSKYKTAAYVRLNPIGLVEYVGIQRMPHGCKTCTMDIALIPLYVPMNFLLIGFGDRIGRLMGKGDFWWDHQNLSVATVSFQNMADALEAFAMPWFKRYENEETYLQDLKDGRYYPGYDGTEYAFYEYLKRGDFQGAQHFLKIAHTLPLYEQEKSFSLPNAFEQSIERLQTLLASIDHPQNHINSCIEENIIKLKYPAVFRTKK